MKKKTFFIAGFALGILLCLIGAFLMIFAILPLSARITIVIVGLALIATSPIKILK